MSEIQSNLGTMVINGSEPSTMKQYGTAPGQGGYTPDFIKHLDQNDSRRHQTTPAGVSSPAGEQPRQQQAPVQQQDHQDVVQPDPGLAGRDLARQLQQIAGGPVNTGINESELDSLWCYSPNNTD